MVSFLLAAAIVSSIVHAIPTSSGWGPSGGRDGTPTVTIKNGTITGVHSSTYNQDLFLGIPFAQAPVDELRFRIPQSISTKFKGGVNIYSQGAPASY